MPPRHRFAARALAGAVVLALAACSEPLGLPAPALSNFVDTLSLFALEGTPLTTPSAYRLSGRQLVRTDQSADFDFAFNIDASNRPVLLPTGAVGLPQGSGIQVATQGFDALTVAPTGGYGLDQPVAGASASGRRCARAPSAAPSGRACPRMPSSLASPASW